MSLKNRRRIGRSRSSKKGLGRNILIILILFIVLAGVVAGFILFETEKPQVTLNKELLFLGSPQEIQLKAADHRSGIQQILIVLRQNEKEFQLF
ncbi:MAG: hypothetical protein D3907_02525, partial [Candidatus Electrothrix sp. AUS3]|nr:hypothetical protein [Candidatus Electrothrix gigas]